MDNIEELEEPVIKANTGDVVELTHACYGFTIQPWSQPQILGYRVLGTMVEGTFQFHPGTDEIFPIEGDDFQTLLAADGGKPAGRYNVKDLIVAFKSVRERLAAPPVD